MIQISIIVPIYKVEKYLRRSIDSIVSQDFEDMEIILVNDGSPDKCGMICEEYAEKDKRIKVIHKANGGVSSARNAGLKAASGQYIWFVDADDWIEPNAVQSLFNEKGNTDVDLILFGHNRVQNIKKFNRSLDLEKFGLYNMDLIHFFKEYYFSYKIGFVPWNKIYKREVINSYGLWFDTEETFGEDLLFNLVYYLNIKNILFINGVFYNYYIREGSAERTLSDERHIQQMRLLEKFLMYINQNNKIHKDKNIILTLLFFVHLVSGINQSKQYNITTKKIASFLKCIFEKEIFKTLFTDINLYKAVNIWISTENPSWLSRIKFNLFAILLNMKMFKFASLLLLT